MEYKSCIDISCENHRKICSVVQATFLIRKAWFSRKIQKNCTAVPSMLATTVLMQGSRIVLSQRIHTSLCTILEVFYP